MKAFTDIEQSKRLAEILPLESADHHYVRKVTDFMGKPVDVKWSIPKYGCPNSKHANYMVQNFTSYEVIPCWSLAALLDVYPVAVGKDLDMYCCWQNSKNLCSKHYDNPVDACVEMIYKLKERNLI